MQQDFGTKVFEMRGERFIESASWGQKLLKASLMAFKA
jgi:hypothetical protein